MPVRNNEIVSLILAAGKSTRMHAPDRAKVCFPVAGRPAIIRALNIYRNAGVKRHIIVVGHHAEEVMRTVKTTFSGEAYFAFQADALGTGNAAKCGAELLGKLGHPGLVLVVAGDKVIRPGVIERLIEKQRKTGADLVFITAPRAVEPDAGRVIIDQNKRPVASVEKFDSGRSRLLALYFGQTEKGGVIVGDRALALAREFIGTENKIRTALGDLYKFLKAGIPLTREKLLSCFSAADRLIRLPGGRTMTGAEVEKSQQVNLSVYLFKVQALLYALAHIDSANAQKEEYLTDAIAILAAAGKYKLIPMLVEAEDEVLAFNTREELERIEAYYHSEGAPSGQSSSLDAGVFKNVTEWLDFTSSKVADLRRRFAPIYGSDAELVGEKVEFLKSCLLKFYQRFGDGPALVTRAPARLNLMGRHVDHQGGICSTLAVDYDVFLVARPRDDQIARVTNLDEKKYPDAHLNLDYFGQQAKTQSWPQFVSSRPVRKYLEQYPANWTNYLFGAFLRFQKQFPEHRLRGMDICISGNIPPATGLSSSSALVVAVAEAITKLNQLDIKRGELSSLSAEAEWFVGTRGGAGDHATIIHAQEDTITPLQFFPLRIGRPIPWDSTYRLVLMDSGIEAKKNGEARALFNQRIACYHFGFELLLKEYPALLSGVKYLRDLVPEKLNMPLGDFYQLLKTIPESISGKELEKMMAIDWHLHMPGVPDAAAQLFSLRNIIMYGLAECARSRLCPALLLKGEVGKLGKLMALSHNGDRVASLKNGKYQPFRIHYTDRTMDTLSARAKQKAASSALYLQPGAYGCSLPAIDQLVDCAVDVDGVRGAQVSGAGLGGSVMAIVHRDAIDALASTVEKVYYRPRGLEPKVHICKFVRGSQVLEI